MINFPFQCQGPTTGDLLKVVVVEVKIGDVSEATYGMFAKALQSATLLAHFKNLNCCGLPSNIKQYKYSSMCMDLH